MISRYEAELNGIALSSLNPNILVLDIKHQSADPQTETYSVGKRNGSRIYRRYYESCSVTILFEIHEYNVWERQSICNAVSAWAKNGGKLETSDRKDQFLQCVCTSFPKVESAKRWTNELSITFTAYAFPFWQEKHIASKAFTGTSGSGTLYIPGNADDALVEVDVKANASLSSVSLTVNGRTLSLTGLSLSTNDVIKISYDGNAIQSIKVGTTSLLDKRSGVDDLLAKCGEYNSFSMSASASATVTFKVRGQWM